MYFLFRYKGWEPSKYYWLKQGEKKIIRAFVMQEIKEREDMAESLNDI